MYIPELSKLNFVVVHLCVILKKTMIEGKCYNLLEAGSEVNYMDGNSEKYVELFCKFYVLCHRTKCKKFELILMNLPIII
jgi:hypothetical protein